VEFASRMVEMIAEFHIKTKRIWFSDDAHFWLSYYVNKQNHRFWARKNPRIFQTSTTKPQRVTVWCAISEAGIIGPVFLTQNVNGERYKRMLLKEFIPIAHGLNAIRQYWFMQDGALPNRTNEVFEVLDEHFSGRVIGLGYPSKFDGGMDWPPYSPDLNPCDFFLWGFLKDKIYRDNPQTLDQLKYAINRKLRLLTELYSKTWSGDLGADFLLWSKLRVLTLSNSFIKCQWTVRINRKLPVEIHSTLCPCQTILRMRRIGIFSEFFTNLSSSNLKFIWSESDRWLLSCGHRSPGASFLGYPVRITNMYLVRVGLSVRFLHISKGSISKIAV